MLKNGFTIFEKYFAYVSTECITCKHILANNMKYSLIQEALTNAKDDSGNDISDENTIFVLTFWFSTFTKEAYFQY